MIYNFDEIVDRGIEYSAKYYELEEKFGDASLIPMWIADMDFKVAQPIIDAMQERLNSGIFGYTSRPKFYTDAIIDWFEKRHDWTLDENLLTFSPGVVPALSVIISELTETGDNIIIQQPVYSPFESVVKNLGRDLRVNPLIKNAQGDYEMDYDHLESLMDDQTKFIILCNPHNPVGRVWRREELEKLAELCLKHKVKVISDEIHCDLVFKKNKHIPFATVSEEMAKQTITCFAPSKSFNIPGLQASIIASPDQSTKELITAAYDKLDITRNNCFSMNATHAAYSGGGDWLDQVMDYIEGNAEFVADYVAKHIPSIHVTKGDGTYLLWLDCRGLSLSDEDLRSFMIEKAKLALGNGADYGIGGSGYQRMNIACPRSVVEKALEQLKEAVKSL